MTAVRDSLGAFDWITNLLKELRCPYAVVGGLAAQVYGGKRPLYDIDIDLPKAVLSEIALRAQSFVVFGPARYVDDSFDIELLTLRYAGQDIDLTAAEDTKLYNRSLGTWCEWPTDLTGVEMHLVLGKLVPVLTRSKLIAYKELIARDTDIQDVQDICTSDPRR